MEIYRTPDLSEINQSNLHFANLHFGLDISALCIREILSDESFEELIIRKDTLYTNPSFVARSGGTRITIRSVNPESHVKSKLEKRVDGFFMFSDILIADDFTLDRDSYKRKIEQIKSLLDHRKANYAIYSDYSVSAIR